jgi:hypothetical protein
MILFAEPTFPIGMLVNTPGVSERISPAAIQAAVNRYCLRDWGDLDEEDTEANNDAVAHGGRILAVYDDNGEKFWIITEYDRSVTTILLPEEY